MSPTPVNVQDPTPIQLTRFTREVSIPAGGRIYNGDADVGVARTAVFGFYTDRDLIIDRAYLHLGPIFEDVPSITAVTATLRTRDALFDAAIANSHQVAAYPTVLLTKQLASTYANAANRVHTLLTASSTPIKVPANSFFAIGIIGASTPQPLNFMAGGRLVLEGRVGVI